VHSPKALTAFAGAMLVLALLAGCNQGPAAGGSKVPESTLTKILREKKLKVGYIHYPPSAFRAPDGKVTGHFAETLEEIIRQLDPGIKVEYEETTWTDFSAALTSGRIDLSIAGTFTTIPRAKVVSFTRPLVYLGRSAVVRRGDKRFSADQGPEQFDRADIKVAVVSGEGSHEYVKARFKHQSNIIVFGGSDLSQALAAVSAGQADVGMSDALETQKYARAHPDVVDLYAAAPYDLTPIAWAVRHEDMIWKDFLDTALHTLEAQGKLREFEARYDFQWAHPLIEIRTRPAAAAAHGSAVK
jgi:ABC-type amino acid transport substrate-binding protein